MNRADYNKGLMDILNDRTKFMVLNEDPTLKREGQLKRYLCKLKNLHRSFFSQTLYDKIYPRGSVPARIYGLPKTHKKFTNVPPFRPVVSSIGTFNYNLAQYLGSLLTPLLTMDYTATDTFTFVNELKQVSFNDKFMVSYDVCSLFTNVPLKETIDLAVHLIVSHHKDFALSKNELYKLFEFATLKSNFSFNDVMYDQIDGVAMGSPLAPILANLFMGHNERQWIDNYPLSKPSFYKRYVDDIFCLFENQKQAELFFNYLNERHPNIKFTMEIEVEKKLPFLDILLNNEKVLTTSVYRKPTYTGLLMNFHSFLPFHYKLGLLRTLIDRTFKITNNWHSFDHDIKKLKEILCRNLFPPHIFQRVLCRYLEKSFQADTETVTNNNEIRYYKLPYIGKFSSVVNNKLKDMVSRYCKDIDIKLVFTGSKLKDSFSCKDRFSSFSHTTLVVYKFSCAGCSSSYIGETERHLSTRINEHFKDKNSHIWKHLNEFPACKEQCTADCFSVLDRSRTKFQLKIKEGLYIKWYSPDLNKQLKHYISVLTI